MAPSAPTPLAEQLAYHRAVAAEYHEHALDGPGRAELLAATEAFTPDGDVLELACGSGVWTERLAQTAAAVTAIDAAPEMLALATQRVDSSTVHFAQPRPLHLATRPQVRRSVLRTRQLKTKTRHNDSQTRYLR